MLEEAEEWRKRRERRNNIIIKSKELRRARDSEINQKVGDILQKLDFKEEYKRITHIGTDRLNNGMVKVELNKFEDKLYIMRNKTKLRGEEFFIDSDLTKNEREIQQAIRQRAREEREKGSTVKVGYQKLCINNEWVNWRDLPPQDKT